ncbi:EpsG family protein [Rhodopirellula halodulae]|uniref:EpsG family protein n=1 Tax=Rhodopirellula halodulae TaxID=2894198 RepID=UPI001E340BCA|nr:EpsG family protein [Rhodopirellula sp. JC737]MCC9655665.1 EpsG family protein [Rhodopirellula sp. JC737]
MLYLIIFVALILIRSSNRVGTENSKLLYSACLISIFLFSAFRFEVGPDWSGYLNIFRIQQWSDYLDASTRSEPGYWLLNEFIHEMHWPYPSVNVFSSMIFFAGLHALAKRQPDPLGFFVLCFPILIINMPMSAVRQAMGIGMLCFAYNAFVDKKLIPFVAFVIIGGSFHNSALVFLLLAPLVTGEYTRNRLILSGLLAIPGVIALASTRSAEVMQSRYIESNVEAAGAIFRVMTLVATSLFFQFMLKSTWKASFKDEFKLVSLGSLMMLALVPLVALSTVVADRFGYYLIPIQTVIFARIPFMLRDDQYRRLFSIAPYAGLFLLFAVWTQQSWIFQLTYIPYQTWLFGFPSGSRY